MFKDHLDDVCFRIETRSKQERSVVLAALLEFGYRWHNENTHTAKSIESEYPFHTYHYVNVTPSTKYLSGSGNSSGVDKIVHFADVVEELFNVATKVITVKLNDEHAAVQLLHHLVSELLAADADLIDVNYKAVQEVKKT